jgi:hypothetical protein
MIRFTLKNRTSTISIPLPLDILSFVAAVIGAVAWPVAVILLVWLLRFELRDLLRIVKKLKAGPVEAEFDRQIENLRAEAQAAAPQLQPTTEVQTQTDPLIDLATRHPRAAILETWRQVEFALRRLADSRDLIPPDVDRISNEYLVRGLTKERLLELEDLAVYYGLRDLRNTAAHAIDFEPSTAAALDYVKTAQSFVAMLDQKTAEPPKS